MPVDPRSLQCPSTGGVLGVTVEDAGWFANLDPDDLDAAADRIREGQATGPADWPARAVESGFAADEDDYYDRLHAAAMAAVRAAVAEREQSDDQQLVHAIRSMDDLTAHANDVAERVAEWAPTRFGEVGTGVAGAIALAERDPTDAGEERIVGLASLVASIVDERDAIRTFVEREAPAVAPNLSALAGPVLASRLIALAGSLEALAKKPSGTVQVLGAEDALFAHLTGGAPSPKHGIIFTHEYVRGTAPAHRGSAARALAGKLSIAARIDHYAGDRRPDLEAELDERIAEIRGRGST